MARLALIIEPDVDSSPGYLGEAAVSHGYRLHVVQVNGQAEVFEDLPDADLVIITGSDEHWWMIDEHPHLQRELTWIQAIVDTGTPILGVCFGGQGLALALGGEVQPMDTTEIGWVALEADRGDLIEPGPWFEWHSDSFTLPDGAELLAHNERGAQAFRWGPHFGLQFHPEVSPELLARWIQAAPHAGADPDQLMEETRRRAGEARRRAYRLFDRFLAHSIRGVRT